jgi:hypothetical protein
MNVFLQFLSFGYVTYVLFNHHNTFTIIDELVVSIFHITYMFMLRRPTHIVHSNNLYKQRWKYIRRIEMNDLSAEGLTSNPGDNWIDPLSGINKKRLKVNAINKINFTNLNPRITGDSDNQ